jgi:two-component system, chemotaxis family, protein-glutamate methylesterase/glutaminase
LYVVAIAASSGGLAALSTVVGTLSESLPAAVVVLQHVSADYVSHLAEILSKRTSLRVTTAVDGAAPEAATIYIAPPGHHLSVWPDGRLKLSETPEQNFVRPSADVLFASLAEVYGNRTLAVVLTGRGRDGADGVKQIKACGGTVIAQDEATSDFFGMPGAAIATGAVDYVIPVDTIAATITALVAGRMN